MADKKNIIQVREFEVGGRRMGLCFSTNALVLLEERFEVDSIVDLMQSWESKTPGMKDIRALAWGGMEGWRMRSDPTSSPFTETEAGVILDALAEQTGQGALQALSDLLTSSMGLDVKGEVEKALAEADKGDGNAADAPLEGKVD